MDKETQKSICPKCKHFRAYPYQRYCDHPSNVKMDYTKGEHEPIKDLTELNGDGNCKRFRQRPEPFRVVTSSAGREIKKPNWTTRFFSLIVGRKP